MELLMAGIAHSGHVPHAFIAQSLIMHVMHLEGLTVQILVADDAPASVELKSRFSNLLPMRMLINVFVIIDDFPIGQISYSQLITFFPI
jgi:hypothetical protein